MKHCLPPLLLLILGWAEPVRAQTPETSVASVVAFQGTVRIGSPTGKIGEIAEGVKLFAGETIKTDRDGMIQFLLRDGSLITLGADSEFVLQEVGQERGVKSILKLVRGSLRAFLRKISGSDKTRLEIQTPTAIAGVRGTHLALIATDDEAQLAVFSGVVHFNATEGTEAFDALDGDWGAIGKGGKILGQHKLTAEDVNRFMAPTYFAPGRVVTGGLGGKLPQKALRENAPRQVDDFVQAGLLKRKWIKHDRFRALHREKLKPREILRKVWGRVERDGNVPLIDPVHFSGDAP